MEITARELRSLVADADDLHHESMRTFPAAAEEVTFGETGRRVAEARRQFLRRAGVGAAALTVVGATAPVRPFGPFAGLLGLAAAQDTPFDITAASYAAGVELAAVAAYQAAAGRGMLDDASTGLATTFASHHQDHAGTFNGLLTANGQPTNTTPDQPLLDQFGPMIANAPDAFTLLDIAYTLENAAASTYAAALGMLTIPEAALAVAQILPVESQHATVLGTVLAKAVEERLPAFETTDASLLAG